MGNFLQKDTRVFVAGHRGLVGSALTRKLRSDGLENLITRSRSELDLRDSSAVQRFFQTERPEVVFLAAAKVGGIGANNTYPADFIRDNLQIQTNVITAAYEAGVARLLFLGSSCIYPKFAPQPISESALLTGELEPTNRPYAVAKIAGIEMCWAFNRQYGTRYVAAMPTNLYGPGDNYDPENSHVIPALIRKFVEATRNGAPEVVIWGTGSPRREFLHSDDLAAGAVYLGNLPNDTFNTLLSADQPPLVNIGYGEDVSIRELAECIAELTGYSGRLVFDITKPDGTPRKLMDSSRIRGLGWRPTISLREGLATVIKSLKTAAVV